MKSSSLVFFIMMSALNLNSALAQSGPIPDDSDLWWREDPNLDDDVWPMSGLAPGNWKTDRTPTLWYESDTGNLQFVAAREPLSESPVGMNSILIASHPPLFQDDLTASDVPELSGAFDHIQADGLNKVTFNTPTFDVAFGSIVLPDLTAEQILDSFLVARQFAEGSLTPPWDLVVAEAGAIPPVDPTERESPPPILLDPGLIQPGDADQDFDFDRFDIIQVLASAKYHTGNAATWAEGDWEGGAGPQGRPPAGDGEFSSWDLVQAQRLAIYANGPYNQGGGGRGRSLPIECCGVENDDRTSLVYDANTGELSVETPLGQGLSSINIDSTAGIFIGANSSRRLEGAFDIENEHTILRTAFEGAIRPDSLSFGDIAQSGLTTDFLLSDLTALGSFEEGGDLGSIDLIYRGMVIQLEPGDANQDLRFDQFDIVQVAQAEKYLTGQPATWGEGDWNGAPGGSPGNPPAGDGVFNQLDIVAALEGGVYLTGVYAVEQGGSEDDEHTSLVYDARSGELTLDAPANNDLTSINITSAASMFIGDRPAALGDAFDNFAPDNIFKATFGGSFGNMAFGAVLPIGLSQAEIAADLTVIGSLQGGGDLGPVDLVYIAVPEPLGIWILVIGIASLLRRRCVWQIVNGTC